MNEQIKMMERNGKEKGFKNNASSLHLVLPALNEIYESVKNIFKEYFGSTQFLHGLGDFDRRIFSDETAVAVVTVAPLYIHISLYPSMPEERVAYHISIDAQASFKNENGYFVPIELPILERIEQFEDRKPSYVQFKTERNLEEVAKIISLYFMNFVKNDYHYVNIEKPDVTIIKRTYTPGSSTLFTEENVEFNY